MSIEDNIDPAARISAIRSVLNDNNAMAHILYKPELRNERSASQALPDSNNSSNDSSTIDPAARVKENTTSVWVWIQRLGILISMIAGLVAILKAFKVIN